jgi:hypothetical protein
VIPSARIAVGIAVASACSSGSSQPSGFAAPHPPAPQVQNKNGPVMTAPKVVEITFAGDTLQPAIDTFVTQLVADAAYWRGAASEYGVGPISALPPVQATPPPVQASGAAGAAPAASLTDADVQAFLTSEIQTVAGFPQPDRNTIYATFFPPGTTITSGSKVSCTDFRGYHSDYALPSGQQVSYAVLPRCPPHVQGRSQIDTLTIPASHEMLESATDPLPKSKPTFSTLDTDHLGWELVTRGGEIADVCALLPGTVFQPAGMSNLVQRPWSNAHAAGSHDPCQPNGLSPYFNTAAVVTDDITVNSPRLGQFTTLGVHIPVGQSQTIELDLFSDAPTSGPWTITALDVTKLLGQAPALSFSLEQSTGQNGDKVHLTINALAPSSLGASPFFIRNQLGNATTEWIGIVGN